MFAGIGGFRTGLANVGDFFVPVGFCEIDKYAQRAYRALMNAQIGKNLTRWKLFRTMYSRLFSLKQM